MDFFVSDELAEHRRAAREWVAANVPPEWLEEQHRLGLHQSMPLHERLARDRILGAGWPAEYGGSDVDPDFARAVYEEIASEGFHMDGWATTMIVINTIIRVGTEEQKRTYITEALRGNVMVALGYSEPDSGSDAAAAKSLAEPV